jgi:acetyl-CoA decarbonylase/synthase complex subunit gamma
VSLPSLDQPFVVGSIQSPAGEIPQISVNLACADRLGTFKARWGAGRMHYTVEPGLYALGKPDEQAPVLVTANYKMSFDRLREALPGRNVWILVLDTQGINVWCAAGKGTFGTMELVGRIESTGLSSVIKHRKLILPQLAGPGVAAHRVKKLSGFRVIYGPVRATDLPAFLEAGLETTPGMRLKTFNTGERVVLIPMELVGALKWTLIILPLFFIISGLLGRGDFWPNASSHGLFAVMALLMTILTGAVLTPLLLPWLPGRAFSLKGLCLGLIAAAVLIALRWGDWATLAGRLEMIAWSLWISAASAYLAMNFTGASTYTSLSGVKKEMRWALPLEIGAGLAGLVLWLISLFITQGF